MFQQDSIQHTATAEQPVLSVQVDSAEQSVFNVRASHWPVKVDSLLMPDMGKELKPDVKPLPKYYKDSFFAKDSTLWHSELQGGRYGIAGDPVPFSIRTDNVLTPLLIFSFLMLILCVRRSSRFFSFQLKNFFRTVRSGSAMEKESASDTRYLLTACLHTAIVFTLLFYLYTKTYVGETYITYSEYTLMLIYFGCVSGFFVIQHLLQRMVNLTFFTTSEHEQWVTVKLLTNSVTGILVSPVVVLMAYFGMSVFNALIYAGFVISLIGIMTFYKCKLIFFEKKGAFLQIFLYFCTLEIIPMLYLWGIMLYIANFLKVNY